MDALIGRVDLNDLVGRLDVDALVGRLDVNELVNRVDLDALVQQTELGGIVAKSTSGLMTAALDAVRSQGVGLDLFLNRWVNRVLRRRQATPLGPPLLIGTETT